MSEANSARRALPVAYYEPLGGNSYRATEAAMSPWDASLQHGGPPTALLTSAIDAFEPKPDMRVARVTVDFMGPLPLADLEVTTRIVRPGKRIELLESTMKAAGKDIAVARAWRICFASGRSSAVGQDAPPAIPDEQEQMLFEGLTDWGYGEATDWRFVRGGYNILGPVEVWTHVHIPLVAGQDISGLQRMLIIADAANGLSAELPFSTHLFVPPSINVTILRYPTSEWIFMKAKTTIADDGIGLTEAHLYDETGLVATVAQPLLVGPR